MTAKSTKPPKVEKSSAREGTPSNLILIKLWTRSGGRCEYKNCNKALWKDELTLAEYNKSNVAHIRGVQPKAARHVPGYAGVHDFANLMLMCYDHHHLIDFDGLEDHSIEILESMKTEHENRIELLTGLSASARTEVVAYGN